MAAPNIESVKSYLFILAMYVQEGMLEVPETTKASDFWALRVSMGRTNSTFRKALSTIYVATQEARKNTMLQRQVGVYQFPTVTLDEYFAMSEDETKAFNKKVVEEMMEKVELSLYDRSTLVNYIFTITDDLEKLCPDTNDNKAFNDALFGYLVEFEGLPEVTDSEDPWYQETKQLKYDLGSMVDLISDSTEFVPGRNRIVHDPPGLSL